MISAGAGTQDAKSQKERLYRLLAQHKIVIDANVESMTHSEADRTIDRILAGAKVGKLTV